MNKHFIGSVSFNLRAVDRTKLFEVLKELWPYLINLDAYVKPLPEALVNRLDQTANINLDLWQIETAGSALPKDVAQDDGAGQKRQGERQRPRVTDPGEHAHPNDDNARKYITPLI